eukprot:gb/GEZN01012876.1/.p1 GENE.gb/GEZN01012876.1/~~gb/GEZN01012876.1/.p1  ORF type:complete len:283 (+),score=39.79 gb/GEZN01012876.1/:53-901(+)
MVAEASVEGSKVQEETTQQRSIFQGNTWRTDLAVSSIIALLFLALIICELLYVLLWPVRQCVKQRLRPHKKRYRRIVFFDGICVLCNNFGLFIVQRLVDRDAVQFVPFQDVNSEEHTNTAALKAEFPVLTPERLKTKMATIGGDKVFWGSDAIMEILSWCRWPYPLIKPVGMCVPFAVRDAIYVTLSNNRHRWFGTQPLANNFARKLCPYYYINKKVFDQRDMERQATLAEQMCNPDGDGECTEDLPPWILRKKVPSDDATKASENGTSAGAKQKTDSKKEK